jgi:hypothetical protein
MRFAALAVALAAAVVPAQQPPANYDEAKVPKYTLPDPLVLADGSRVTTAAQWRERRRREVLALFEQQMFGPVAPRLAGQRVEVRETEPRALGGIATRRQVRVHFTGAPESQFLDLLIYLPNAAAGRKVPAFLALNFNGNHAVHTDPAIALSPRWMLTENGRGVVNHRATEAARGTEMTRFPVERILGAGFALATVYCGDLEPDHAEGWRDGVRGTVAWPDRATAPQTAMGAWSWGLSRALDYLQTDAAVDGGRIAVMGHSRLGKAALWAAAQDERFALAVANESGEGGAAITRRQYGETLAAITTRFPHWFLPAYAKYAGREDTLPFDAHMLLALIAPRPLYVASAIEDQWADPRGEFLGALHAEPVYALFGKTGLGVREMPPLEQPVGDTIGYHVRSGTHDVTAYDWEQYLRFARRHLGHQQ